jgi:hypothetical protein
VFKGDPHLQVKPAPYKASHNIVFDCVVLWIDTSELRDSNYLIGAVRPAPPGSLARHCTTGSAMEPIVIGIWRSPPRT